MTQWKFSGWNSGREAVKSNFIVQSKNLKMQTKINNQMEKVTNSTCLNKKPMNNKNNKKRNPQKFGVSPKLGR